MSNVTQLYTSHADGLCACPLLMVWKTEVTTTIARVILLRPGLIWLKTGIIYISDQQQELSLCLSNNSRWIPFDLTYLYILFSYRHVDSADKLITPRHVSREVDQVIVRCSDREDKVYNKINANKTVVVHSDYNIRIHVAQSLNQRPTQCVDKDRHKDIKGRTMRRHIPAVKGDNFRFNVNDSREIG